MQGVCCFVGHLIDTRHVLRFLLVTVCSNTNGAEKEKGKQTIKVDNNKF